MRFTSLLAAYYSPKGRMPQREDKVPFRTDMPMKLRDRLSGKYDGDRAKGCLHEMYMVLACLAENEYENKLCKKQVDTFNKCYETYLQNSWHAKKARERGILVPGDEKFTSKQLSKLFRTYRNV